MFKTALESTTLQNITTRALHQVPDLTLNTAVAATNTGMEQTMSIINRLALRVHALETNQVILATGVNEALTKAN